MIDALSFLKSIDFDWTRHLQSVWQDASYHADEVNGQLADELVEDALNCGPLSPLGRVILGQAGSGKTHLVGELRRRIWKQGGWFVLFDLTDVNDFWATAALGYLEALQQPYADGLTQGNAVLQKLCASASVNDVGLGRQLKRTVSGHSHQITELASTIIEALRDAHPKETQQHRNVVRALLMLQAADSGVSDIASSWLQSVDVEDPALGPVVKPRDVVRGLSWLMSLTGPTLVAIDQIDAIVSVHMHALHGSDAPDSAEQNKALTIIDGLARGLMDLRDVTRRTLTVLSSLEETWEVLKNHALKPATARFRDPDYVRPIHDGSAGLSIVTGRLTAVRRNNGFSPPYASWPFHPDAFTEVVGLLPRELLQRCDRHVRQCLRNARVAELRTFDGGVAPAVDIAPSGIEERFHSLRENASLKNFADSEKEESHFANLLIDTLRCYALQVDMPSDVDVVVDADRHKSKPALHARLRHVYRAQGDRELHHCFRAILHNNARAFQARLKAAMTAAGIDMALQFRHLIVIHHDRPPSGPKTKQMCDEFEQAGGKFVALQKDDLKSMIALQVMLREHPDGFEAWLKKRKPLCGMALIREAGLCGNIESPPTAPNTPKSGTTPPPRTSPTWRQDTGPIGARSPETTAACPQEAKPPPQATIEQAPAPSSIPIGRRLIGGEPEQQRFLAINLLPRHTAILAGSGSGKTVLLRRIVEEVALLGMPAIVLDTNNDLARLGDPWPSVPVAWDDSDRQKARAYQETVEAVIWTPGISGGKPIVLAPMPDFVSVRGDKDELEQTVQMAYAALQPLVGAKGAKGTLKEGVLMEALRYFAKSGVNGLEAFVRLLSDLPEEASGIGDAAKLANAMADSIKAEMAKNPLLGGKGAPLDPRLLFTSEYEGRTRISVINFSGLPTDEAKQAFVNQLQMTLFSWIKKNPAPLRGLFVMDEAQNFAPALKSTPCKASTIALVAQARKYGLGMIFATQVPKNIDNKIISNCTTHFYGKMNAPVTIQAIQELMASKGGRGDDIGTLKAGEFYLSTDGRAPEKIKTPLCLSYHPQSPLSQEEVVERARETILSMHA